MSKNLVRLPGILRREDGNAMVELAVVAPFLILMMLGSFEIGRYLDFSIKLGNAARAGVQYGSLNVAAASNLTGMQNAATNDANGITFTPKASNYCTCADGSASTCQPTDCSSTHIVEYVKLVATGSMTSVFGAPGIPGTANVSATAIMRVAQ